MAVDLAARVTVMTAEAVCVDVAAELVLFTPMSTRLLLVCRFRWNSVSWAGICGAAVDPFPTSLN